MKRLFPALLLMPLCQVILAQGIQVQIEGMQDTLEICEGTEITFQATGADSYSWIPAGLFDDPNSDSPAGTFSEPVWVYVTGTTGEESGVDSIYVDVDPYFFPTLVNDTTVCEGVKTSLTRDTFDRDMMYDWSPGVFLNDSTIASPVAMPMETDTTFVLIASSRRGFCSDTDSVRINIIENDVEIILGGPAATDTAETCLGMDVTLQAISDPPSPIQWMPAEYLTNVIGNTVTDTGKISHTIIAMVENGGCKAFDSIFVRVDSLPIIDTFDVVPIKEYYCPGDEIIIYSRSYDRGLYPDIMHQWGPTAGFVDDMGDDLNTALRAQMTTTYRRTTTNHACRQVDTILIRVVDPEIPVDPADTIVCPGEPVQATADDTGIDGDLTWMPEEGVTCTDLAQKCNQVVLMTPQTQVFTVTGEKMGCPASGMTIVNTFTPPAIQLVPTPSQRIPVGTEVTVTAVTNAPGATFSWEVDGIPFNVSGNQLSGTEDEPVTRTFVVTVTDANGCPNVGSLDVEWFVPPVSIRFPNVFTPNGDGENDFFRAIVEGDVVVEELYVFNRWGQLMFDNEDPVQGWDGTHGGGEAPSDVYVWWASMTVNGENQKFKGNITLLR